MAAGIAFCVLMFLLYLWDEYASMAIAGIAGVAAVACVIVAWRFDLDQSWDAALKVASAAFATISVCSLLVALGDAREKEELWFAWAWVAGGAGAFSTLVAALRSFEEPRWVFWTTISATLVIMLGCLVVAGFYGWEYRDQQRMLKPTLRPRPTAPSTSRKPAPPAEKKESHIDKVLRGDGPSDERRPVEGALGGGVLGVIVYIGQVADAVSAVAEAIASVSKLFE